MTKQFVWLLDVDGVINASEAGWSAPPYSGIAYAYNNSYKIRWAPQLIERIRKIHRLDNVRILWATTWVGYTTQLENLFKLPALPSAGPTGMGSGEKLKAAEAVLASGNKLIWTDDEAIPLDWESNDNQLVIRPKSSRGLRPEHLRQIEEFVIGS